MRAGARRWRWLALGVGLLFLLRLMSLAFLPPSAEPSAAPDARLDDPQLKERILRLSRDFLGRVAREQAADIDSPYSFPGTAYDLKKTLAVLLESMMGRIENLEARLGNLSARDVAALGDRPKNDLVSSTILSANDLVNGAQEKCPTLPAYAAERWPNCAKKLEWMRGFWTSDACYGHFGVDGSECSFRIYLSEVERHCPPLPFRPTPASAAPPNASAGDQTDLEQLFKRMADNPGNFQWMQQRLRRLWPSWLSAYEALKAKAHWFKTRKRKRILLHLGSLTKESGFKFGAGALVGGPLGELVQWSDLVASLYLLGHELTISSEIKTFVAFAQADPALKSSCPVPDRTHHVDLIFTDIVGLRQMKRKIPGSLQNYKCRLRVLDSFGTQAEFNFPPYFTAHKTTLGGAPKNAWGGHQLRLPQFYTMYPHSHDNTFLGFVVETFGASASSETRQDWALVYGKAAYMWKGKEAAVAALRDAGLEVHATVGGDASALPAFVTNHGVLSSPELHSLLRKVRVFLGLGFPFEGPAPLEAIVNGAVYINPTFAKPKGRGTDPFFAEKPTLRLLKSQNPYAEEFIGPPYVISVDIENGTALRSALLQAKSASNPGHLPYEMTEEGMLERVGALVEHQDFCSSTATWPPFSAATTQLGAAGASCSEACAAKGRLCEPAWWTSLNRPEAAEGKCVGEGKKEAAPDAPLWAEAACVFQSQPLLFSCASKPRTGARRLCPCRDAVKDQVALCAACL